MQKTLANSPLFNVVLFSGFWALQVFVSKVAFNHGAEVLPFTVQSTVVCILLLTPYVLIRKRQQLRSIPRPVLLGLLAASAIHGGLGGFLANAGVSLTTSINAGFLLQFSTITTALLAWVILKERMTVTKATTIVVIAAGTFLLITKGHFDAPQSGDLLIILACVAWSTGNIMVRRLLKREELDSDIVTFFRPLAGLPVILAFAAFAPLYPNPVKPTFDANLFEFHAVGYMLLNAVFSVLLWLFLNRTLKIASASYMTMMGALTPVLVAGLALVFLHETLEPVQWLGVALILASSFVTQLIRVDKH